MDLRTARVSHSATMGFLYDRTMRVLHSQMTSAACATLSYSTEGFEQTRLAPDMIGWGVKVTCGF